jgi:type VI secretion system secreted protein VgrG
VHTARRLGSDGSLTSYQFGFASWMHFLRFRKDARIWQNKSADTILADVFNLHPQARGAFRFVLKNPLPARSFCMQYEDDWNFVHRLMESEGLFSYFEQADDGKSHTLVITDDLYSVPAIGQTISFYRAGTNSETDALVQWSGMRTLQSTTLATRTFDYKSPGSPANPKGTNTPTLTSQGNLPQQAEVYEYTGAYTYGSQDRGDALSKIRMEEWESRAKRFYGSGGVRQMDSPSRNVVIYNDFSIAAAAVFKGPRNRASSCWGCTARVTATTFTQAMTWPFGPRIGTAIAATFLSALHSP